jgi:hypothetical protein
MDCYTFNDTKKVDLVKAIFVAVRRLTFRKYLGILSGKEAVPVRQENFTERHHHLACLR